VRRGEYIADTLVRETGEESGIDVEVTGLGGVYTNCNHVVEYSDGDVRKQFSFASEQSKARGHQAGGVHEPPEDQPVPDADDDTGPDLSGGNGSEDKTSGQSGGRRAPAVRGPSPNFQGVTRTIGKRPKGLVV
jgi:hypothetical protein